MQKAGLPIGAQVMVSGVPKEIGKKHGYKRSRRARTQYENSWLKYIDYA